MKEDEKGKGKTQSQHTNDTNMRLTRFNFIAIWGKKDAYNKINLLLYFIA